MMQPWSIFLRYWPSRRGGVLAAVFFLVGPVSAEEHATQPHPTEARGGVVSVTPGNTQPLLPGDRRLMRVVFPDTDALVLGAKINGTAHQMLRRLFATGKAAGNSGDLYENRDRGHSRLSAAAYPQLTHIVYDDTLRSQGQDYGLGLTMLFDAPLIGNSSTAVTGGAIWRSLPRLALTTPGGADLLYQNYASGQIHVYPEHRDHDPERGDLFPANTPYMLISQGSSGSDRPHLEALVMILAAFRPDTKEALRQAGLIASTVQMVYRRARVGVRSRAAYLSGAAHPTVFRARDIALARMVGLANAIKPDEIPPMVRLKVLEESKAEEGVDFFGEGLSEALFDTPSAIARVWRSRAGRRSMIVTAADTRDPNGRDLQFEWVMLRGDPGRVRITPLTPDGRYAQIEMDWQAPLPTPGAPDTLSHRIDIGVFANNGIHDSAPAFISILLPRHETRVYEAGPDGALRINSIDRGAAAGVYADPLLFPELPWRDQYQYDAAGKFTGWVRYRSEQISEYDAVGARIMARDTQGAPVETTPMRYPIERDKDGSVRLWEEVVPVMAGQ
jgi:hypothetical protein